MDTPEPGAPRPLHLLFAPALIAILVLAIYASSWKGGFLNYDDDYNLTSNLHYRGFTRDNLAWMFTNHYGHYIPVTWLSFALDYTLWGMNPLGYRLTNTLFHALNAILLFLILKILFRFARADATAPRIEGAALAGALFFAVHPLRVASVAWITERRDMLSGAFFFLTILAWFRWAAPTGERRLRWLVLAALSFALMIFSKALGITLPLVLLILDVWPLRRWSRQKLPALLLEKLPFFALMAVGLTLTSMAQRTADTIYTREQYPLTQSLVQPGFRVSFYVWKTLLPIRLSPLYFYRPQIGLEHALGWAMVLGLTLGLFLQRKRVPGALVAWLSYGLMIAPVCGVFQAGPHYANDIWSYLPCTPFAALFGGGLLLPAARRILQGVGAGAVVLLAALGVLSVRETPVYQTSRNLWDRAIRLDPEAYFSWHLRGRAKAEEDDLPGAIEDFSKAISLRSGYPEPWHERGLAWSRMNRPELAAEDFRAALRIDPTRVNSSYQLGLAELRLGRRNEALVQFSRALELRPGFPEALLQRARLRAGGGDLRGALADMDSALAAAPQASLHLERATIRAIGGDLEGAIADFTESIRLKPDYADAWARRGVARMQRGDSSGAAQDFTRALEVAPQAWPGRGEIEQLLRRSRNPR